jgi:hypothetical protein
MIADISIIVNVVLVMTGAIMWLAAPPSAKLLLKKKLGFYKAQTLNLVADRDRIMQLEAQDVRFDGMLEGKKVRSGMKSSFYLGRVRRDYLNNIDQNEINKRLEDDVLPPYSLDGIPIYQSYIGTAFATNPAVLTAIRYKDKPSEFKNGFDSQIMLPEPLEVDGVPVDNIEVKVMLPFDPKDIAKALPEEFAQIDVGDTKVRSRLEGEAARGQDGHNTIKIMIIGAIVSVGIIAGAVIALKIIGA